MRNLLTVLTMLLVSCTGIPQGITPVQDFELNRYLGTWYEIARLDHSFERGLTDIRAGYSLRDDGGVKVLNSGYNPTKKSRDTAEGKAYFVGKSDLGRLQVSFFGPFYGAYNIIALDKQDYRWAMICGPNRDYLWILSRTPILDESILQTLISEAKALGFSTEQLILDSHS
ncbi:lipocalin [Candidatus Methylospira mobilis]|uniref:Outer membrane lipoprotein Blc n=1 Tax=Candidatus Methylospira mobilis TaxID=1808979 RepID=A0A5Q0BQ34_9GAMM|nr:lipocalin family protein [Candidatus Methylospira mobilis]QFY44314.1 lipocalin [Candidatus Methylospira mobilis]WNV06253.1 lipocalin family protein [Candidatus Methylospira mobilis]